MSGDTDFKNYDSHQSFFPLRVFWSDGSYIDTE